MACIFPLLKAPDSYDPSTLDYDEMERRGLPGKAEWIEVFRASLPQYFKMICADASLPEAEREQVASQFVTDFNAALDALVTDCTRQVPVLEEQLPRETRLTCVRLW